MASGSEMEPDDRPAGYVQSFERGLAVITAFSKDAPRLRLADVARRCDITRAAARRYLITLEALGYVGSDGREFFLMPRILELGHAYLTSSSVAAVAQTHLAPLARELSESCSASVLDRDDIVYVSRTATNRIMSIKLAVGDRLPAYCTAMGRVLLASLPDDALEDYLAQAVLTPLTPHTITEPDALREEILATRARGWCTVDQELELGVRSLALPLRDATGVVAAMNVSAHAARMTIDELKTRVLDAARESAAGIDADLRLLRG